MKVLRYHKRFWISCILPFVLTMCMTIENITHPDNALVNSEIEIKVDVKLTPINSDQTKLIFAVLAPVSWNIADNANLTFTTNGYSAGDVMDESMILVSDSEMEPATKMSWSTSLENVIGFMGNLGPVEWVVFESASTFSINNNVDNLISASVKIKLTTGNDNIKLLMGYFFCGKSHGLDNSFYTSNAKSKVLRVTGGTNELIDYTSDVQATEGELPDYSVFTVGNVFSNYYMEVEGDILFNEKFKDYAKIDQHDTSLDYENLPDKWFRWYFIYKETIGEVKYYQIMNAMSGKFLSGPGSQLLQYSIMDESQKDIQLWQITEVSNGSYKIINKANGLALTANSNSIGGSITQTTYSGSEQQQWELFPYDLCSYRDDEVVRFFERNDKSSGSTAFDQGSSIPLSDGSILWITQDSWDGWELTANNMFYSNYFFNYGNSMFIQPSKDNWNPDVAYNITRENSLQNKPRQICDIQPGQSFAWPSNGVELNNKVYLICGEGNDLSAEGQSLYELWPKQDGSLVWNVVRHLIPTISDYKSITYAAGMVHAEDGYVYVFGTSVIINAYSLYVARFSEDDPLNTWTFWNGSAWSANPPSNENELNAARIFEGQGASVAVSYVNGKYVVLSLDQGFWETEDHKIRTAISDEPNANYTSQIPVYDICENIYGTQAKYYTPNIHPVFDNGRNELLVTYSLNYSANQDQDISCNEYGEKIVDGNVITKGDYIDPYFYRVKGVRVPYSAIGIPENDIPSSIQALQDVNSETEIFPNPVVDELYIKSTSLLVESFYDIFDLSGRIVNSGKIENNRINVSTLSEGVYVLIIKGSENSTHKFIKIHH
nr:DUF4961 domain-containing protein [uncultured Carboxylicivirga sp.]